MRQLNSLYILFTLILLLLAPNLTKAELISEAAEIPFQVNNSNRIMIGTVSGIDTYYNYTIYTITVEEWLYNPLPAAVIKVRTEIGTNFWTEDEAEFTQNESTLLMLKDENLDQQLFRVAIGSPGKHSVSDRNTVIEELKAQDKWQEENQTVDKTNDTGVTESTGTVDEQEEGQNKTNDTEVSGNTERTGEQEEKSNTTPFISPVWTLAAISGAVMYTKRK